MLFLFRGRNGPAVRTVLGLVLVIVGLVVSTPVVTAIGAVLFLWGLWGLVISRRANRDDELDDSGRMP